MSRNQDEHPLHQYISKAMLKLEAKQIKNKSVPGGNDSPIQIYYK